MFGKLLDGFLTWWMDRYGARAVSAQQASRRIEPTISYSRAHEDAPLRLRAEAGSLRGRAQART